MSIPVLSPNYNQGYPSPILVHAESITFSVDNEYFLSILDNQINEGYLSYRLWSDITNAKVQVRPFPKILPSVISGYNENYPVINEVDITNAKVQVRPFPKILPSVISGYNENYPVINEVDITNAKVQVKPFPRILPDMENPQKLEGYPSFGWNDGLDDFGAFARANITKIKIPESVKFIQDFAFYDTNVKKVKIAVDCIYFEHSFPEECEIEFYE